MKQETQTRLLKRINGRRRMNLIAKQIFLMAAIFCFIFLFLLIARVVYDGLGWISFDFLTSKLSTQVDKAGIFGAILGTLWLMAIVAPITMIIGICTAIYLELYMKDGPFKSILQTNIANLAGVPSIVYGILGLTVFVRFFHLGSSVLAGGLTLSLLVLPIVIVSSQEAIRTIPAHMSEGSYGLGATKWQTIWNVLLPAALPGMLTGGILAVSRAIGETAPLVVLGIPALILAYPKGILDTFTVLPMQIYYWTLDSSLTAEYANLAAATIITLLAVLLILNASAIIIRNKFQKTNQ